MEVKESGYDGYAVLHALGLTPKGGKGWQAYPEPCPCCGKKNKLSIYMPTGYLKCFYAGCEFNDSPSGVSFVSYVMGCDKATAYKMITGEDSPAELHRRAKEYVAIEPEEMKQVLTTVEKHKAYEGIFKQMRLSEKDHKDLLERGLTDDEIKKLDYRTLSVPGFDDEVKLFSGLKDRGIKYIGLPGEWHKNDKMFPHINMGNMNALMLRCRDIYGYTYGVPLRIPDEIRKNKEDMPKYMWLSSAKKENGHGIPVKIHYAIEREIDREKKIVKPIIGDTIYLIEGVLKGDICHMKSGKPFACVSGVGQYKSITDELPTWHKLGIKKVVICYDMDYKTNPGVSKALKKVTKILNKDGFVTKQLEWDDKWKGLDDFLVSHPNLTLG